MTVVSTIENHQDNILKHLGIPQHKNKSYTNDTSENWQWQPCEDVSECHFMKRYVEKCHIKMVPAFLVNVKVTLLRQRWIVILKNIYKNAVYNDRFFFVNEEAIVVIHLPTPSAIHDKVGIV